MINMFKIISIICSYHYYKSGTTDLLHSKKILFDI